MAETMLAGRLDLRTRVFRVEEIPIPEPADDEVRVEVAAAGVCLSDVHLIDGTLRGPDATGTVTLGHEVAGTIESVGRAVPGDIRVGQRVILQAGQACGRCANCVRHRVPCPRSRTRGVHYDGGWARYALARHDTVVPIPDELPFDQAAIIPDAISTPYAAIVTTAGVRPAQAVGVWGIGGLGAHGVQLLRLVGAAPIIAVDPSPGARARALEFGADLALDSREDDVLTRIQAVTGGGVASTSRSTSRASAPRESRPCRASGWTVHSS